MPESHSYRGPRDNRRVANWIMTQPTVYESLSQPTTPATVEPQAGPSRSHQLSGTSRGTKRRRSPSIETRIEESDSEGSELEYGETELALLESISLLIDAHVGVNTERADRQRAIRIIVDFAEAQGWDEERIDRAIDLASQDEVMVDIVITLSPEVRGPWLSLTVPAGGPEVVQVG